MTGYKEQGEGDMQAASQRRNEGGKLALRI